MYFPFTVQRFLRRAAPRPKKERKRRKRKKKTRSLTPRFRKSYAIPREPTNNRYFRALERGGLKPETRSTIADNLIATLQRYQTDVSRDRHVKNNPEEISAASPTIKIMRKIMSALEEGQMKEERKTDRARRRVE